MSKIHSAKCNLQYAELVDAQSRWARQGTQSRLRADNCYTTLKMHQNAKGTKMQNSQKCKMHQNVKGLKMQKAPNAKCTKMQNAQKCILFGEKHTACELNHGSKQTTTLHQNAIMHTIW